MQSMWGVQWHYFFKEIEKSNSKIYREINTLKSQHSLSKKDKTGDITLPDFNLYHKAIAVEQYGAGIKQAYKSMKIIESPEINPWIYGQSIFNKGVGELGERVSKVQTFTYKINKYWGCNIITWWRLYLTFLSG